MNIVENFAVQQKWQLDEVGCSFYLMQFMFVNDYIDVKRNTGKKFLWQMKSNIIWYIIGPGFNMDLTTNTIIWHPIDKTWNIALALLEATMCMYSV